MTTDPYSVLELTPTREISQVKRAYFAALTRHPPQTDPEGFRRVRDAYEMLSNPATLAAAFAAAPVDLPALEKELGARFDARIEEQARLAVAKQTAGAAVQQFIERFSGQSWAEALGTLPPS